MLRARVCVLVWVLCVVFASFRFGVCVMVGVLVCILRFAIRSAVGSMSCVLRPLRAPCSGLRSVVGVGVGLVVGVTVGVVMNSAVGVVVGLACTMYC